MLVLPINRAARSTTKPSQSPENCELFAIRCHAEEYGGACLGGGFLLAFASVFSVETAAKKQSE